MTERSTETVSALMDGEVSDFELRRILDRMDEEPELSDAWQRYQLISSVIRNEEIVDPRIDISNSVMAAVAEEPDYYSEEAEVSEGSGTDRRTYFWKPLTSMAVAASVTAMVIFGAQSFNPSSPVNQVADNRPGFTLPANTPVNDFVRAQFGNRQVFTVDENQPDIIRLPQGLERYIDQHKHMLQGKQSSWQTAWLPEGYKGLREDIMPHAEVQVFSNGRNTFTVCIEEYGRQSVPEGMAEHEGMVAVGKRMGDQFVTVVGDVPLMIAERIAASVKPK
jgi:negative regulator of sigma E activity